MKRSKYKKAFDLFNDLKMFCKENKSKLLWIIIIYMIPIMYIGLSEYPYIDDIGRQIQGYSGFAEHYSRLASEILGIALNGGTHMTDLGLTTFLVSIIFLSLTSFVVVYVFSEGKKLSIISVISSTLIGLNPWFLEALSFRFDNPFMTFSLLISVLPFLFWKKHIKLYAISSVLAIYLMCNSYQASSGLYILMVMSLSFVELVQGKKVLETLKKVSVSAIYYFLGLLIYFVQIKLFPPVFSDSVQMSSFSQILPTIVNNTNLYINNIWNQSAMHWKLITIAVLLLFLVSTLLVTKLNFLLSISLISGYVILGTVFSYGSYLVLLTPYSLLRPRYEYGFAIFITLILVLLSNMLEKGILKKLNLSVISLLCFYIISFSLLYPSMLRVQNNSFKSQAIILGGDLNSLNNIHNVKLNRFFRNSSVYENSVLSYPILTSLIMTNMNVSWDMTMRFNEVTKLDLDLQLFNEEEMDKNSVILYRTTKLYDVYVETNESDTAYVIMK